MSDPEIHEVARILVGADVPSARMLRVNVSLPEDLVRRIDQRTNNRSRFLVDAAERQLVGASTSSGKQRPAGTAPRKRKRSGTSRSHR